MENKKKEISTKNVNDVLKLTKKLLKAGYLLILLLLILLLTYIVKEWHIFKFIGELLIVISPLFIGFILAWLLDPIIKKLSSKNKMRRGLATIIVYLLLILILVLIISIFLPQLANQVKVFIDNFPETLSQIRKFINNILLHISETGIDTASTKSEIYSGISKLNSSITSNLPTYLYNVGKSLVVILTNIGLGIMVGFYLSLSFDKVNSNTKKLLPKKYQDDYDELMKRINTTLRSYVSGVLIIMFLVFLTQSIGFTLVGLEAPLIFALFCAITDVIPYFGPYIGAIPAIIVAFTISPMTGLFTIIAILIVQQLENNFYQPLIMGHTMSLHPVTIMIGLLVFGHFFGLLGMIFATPIIATLKIIFEFFSEKKSIVKELTKIENVVKID